MNPTRFSDFHNRLPSYSLENIQKSTSAQSQQPHNKFLSPMNKSAWNIIFQSQTFIFQKEQRKSKLLFTTPIILLNNLEIGVIHSNIFQQELPQTVPDFSEIIEHSIPKINPNPSSKNYHIVMEKLSRINMRQLEPQQQTQLKELIAEFADIFAENNNNLERTNLVQH
ncbi:hypothetical protein G9A89_004184 [Geosiphon pyriformis]|nr:hypothetical protein G9A89_004184 [Geosiphon pyriformis]